MATESKPTVPPVQQKKKGCFLSGAGCIVVLVLVVILLFVVIVLVRPGVFTIQPIGALPEGVTIIYHSRGPDMPFFSSPDSMCLEIQGGVSLLCRMSAMAASTQLLDRVIVRLPYMRWAYLESTGGLEFDR